MPRLRSVIKQVRIKRGDSVRKVALYCRVHHSIVSRYENGWTDIKGDTLLKMLRHLGFELRYNGKSVWEADRIVPDEDKND